MTQIEKIKLRNLSIAERHTHLGQKYGFENEELFHFQTGGLNLNSVNTLIENAVGNYSLPLGLAENFQIDKTDYLIPMVTEEPSIIAGSSKAAKIMTQSGGITTIVSEPLATGQIQLFPKHGQPIPQYQAIIKEHEAELIELGNAQIKNLVARGGGIKSITAQPILSTRVGEMVIIHFDTDVRDAQGANIINSLAEFLSPHLAMLTGSRPGISILTNLTTHRLAKAVVDVNHNLLPDGAPTKIEESQAWAEADPYRATTHNKGVMNGIIAVALATGNDTRAIEAAAHAHAARSGKYSALTIWENHSDTLHGELEIPLAVGIVGGLTKIHPVAKLSLEIMGIKSAKELASIMVATGLAQNFAALLTLSTTGIQAGHMPLHARRLVNES